MQSIVELSVNTSFAFSIRNTAPQRPFLSLTSDCSPFHDHMRWFRADKITAPMQQNHATQYLCHGHRSAI